MRDKTILPWWAAALAYLFVTLLLFHNLLPDFTTHLYSDLADTLLNTSILAWNAKVLPLTDAWWNYPAFAPLSGVTAFTEHLLVTYPLASPVIWLTGNPVAAYNCIFLLAFPLNGMAAFALGRALTGSSAAGFITGLAYAFSPHQAVHLSHLQMLLAFGMPLALLGMHRYVEEGRRRALIYVGAGCFITTFANAYTLIFFPIFLVLWCLWFVRPREWHTLIAPAATATAAMLPVIPLLWGYHIRQAAYGFARQYYEIFTFGADMTALAQISHRHLLWRPLLSPNYFEGALFPGLVILTLTVIAVRHVRHEGHEDVLATKHTKDTLRGLRGFRWKQWLLYSALVCILIGLARVWTGPFGWHIGPLPLPPFQPHRLFTIAALLFALRLAMTTRVRYACSTRDRLMFYVVAAVLLWLLALGPEPAFLGVRTLTYGPYRLLFELSGVQAVRAPARMWMLGILCLAVAAGFGTSMLIKRWPGRPRLLVMVLAIGIVAEGAFFDTTQEVPRVLRPGIIPNGAQVLDLPIEESWQNVPAAYGAVLAGYRVINGYSGYQPEHFTPFRRALADYRVEALDAYRRLDDLYVIVRPAEQRFGGWIAQQPGAERLFESPEMKIYRLPGIGGPRPRLPLPLPPPGRPAFVVP
jgi:hypothetical protein